MKEYTNSFSVNEIGSSMVLTALFIVMRKIIQSNVADWAIRKFAQPGCDIMKNPKTEEKYRQGCWKLFAHLWIVSFGFVVLLPSDFLYEPRNLWIGAPYHKMSSVIYWYYMIELGYYFSEVLTHCVAVKRKDFFVMLLHHVVTILLILVSYYHNIFKVGAVLMLLHDIMDPFLELAKIGKYLCLKKFSYVMFFLLTITYFYTRLYLIPFYIWKSIIYDVPELLMPNLDTDDSFYMNLYYCCNVLIAILMALNCVWAYFLICAILNLTSGQELVDTRSDDEHND